MMLDDGSRWGEKATPDQWADMEALFDPAGPRKHFWLRARGRSKTTDVGAATLAVMLAGGLRGGDELYAAAAGREQAALLARKMRLIAENTPELRGAVDVQNYRVVTPRTGATLDVLSSDLSTSWGKTPRWIFVDEIANHDSTEAAKGFIDSLITSLPKRRDSVFIAGTTPSSPNHWSHDLWEMAENDSLWRTSIVAGPAPWQDPAELESMRAYLTPSMWDRLYECRWSELDDQLATLEQVRACIGHEGTLPPDPAFAYVHGVDLSSVHDVTAVATCHTEVRDRKAVMVLDRLRAWKPSRGRKVPLDEVEEYVTATVGEYGGLIHTDPWQALPLATRWRNAGFQVKEGRFSPQDNSRRANLLLSLIRERQLDLPEGEDALFGEITSLRLQEGSTPGVLKLTTDAGAKSHFDRAMALMLCAQELMTRPSGSYRDTYGTLRDCGGCSRAYRAERPACPWCSTANPDAPSRSGQPSARAHEERTVVPVQASSWASAYYPPNAVKCGRGHVYDGAANQTCPQCAGGGGSRGGGRGMFGGLRSFR